MGAPILNRRSVLQPDSDFWEAIDSETAQLLAPYENVVVPGDLEAESITTEELRTAPTGALVRLDGNQSIADDTITTVEWEVETSRGEVSDILDPNDNEIIIPEGFEWAKFVRSVVLDDAVDSVDVFDMGPGANIEGDPFRGGNTIVSNQENVFANTAWIPVSQGDNFTTRIRVQGTGGTDIRDVDQTFLEVWLL